MKINRETKLWEDLTLKDVADMRAWAEDAILRGKLAYPDPPWLTLWYSETGHGSTSCRVLMQSTAVPQFVLLSIVQAIAPTKDI